MIKTIQVRDHNAYQESQDNTSFYKSWGTYSNVLGGPTKIVLLSDDKTDSQGRFQITLSGKGNYLISAQHKDFGPSETQEIFIEGGENYTVHPACFGNIAFCKPLKRS